MTKMNEDILDKHTKICICRAISKKTIKSVIAEGADTLKKVQEVTKAGSGSCNGRRCSLKIVELIDAYKQQEHKKDVMS